MRRLTDVIITSDDRPSPPRAAAPRIERQRHVPPAEPARAAKAEAPAKPRRKRIESPARKRLRGVIAIGAAIVVVIGGAAVVLKSGAFAGARAAISARLIDMSLQAGLRVARVEVEGRKRVAADDLIAALGVKQGDPILGVDIAAAQARLAALPGVKSATLQRRLPDELDVLIAEREPIAVWQNDGRYTLVDADGQPAGDNIADYPNLPLVVGMGAPDHAAALLAMIADEKDLAQRVKASQWVSGQRWNIVVTGPEGDIEVRLPEDDPATAWHQLAQIEAEQKLLERKISMVDMRLPDRLVLRIPGGLEPAGKTEKTVPLPAARRKAPGGRDA